ncbi:MAG TPA: AMIN domain-containing protein [Terriglobales bacterium]|nr:AMIN domain-containing protein [Terriglobales bacterium]
MRALASFGLSVFLAVGAGAQSASDAVRLENLGVVLQKNEIKVEVTLTSAITPRVTPATRPDRLLLELPGVGPSAQRAPIPGNQSDVKWVWVETDPKASLGLSRVVVELSGARPYELSVEGSKIVLTILPAVKADSKKRSGPVGAASAPLVGRLHRGKDAPNAETSNAVQTTELTPPPALPPIAFPETQANSTATRSGGNSTGTAPVVPSNQVAQPATLPEPPSPVPSVDAGSPAVGTLNPPGQEPATGSNAEPAAVPVEGDAATQAANRPSQANPDVRIAFRVKYVAEGIAYLEGGRNDGLTEGMKLEVRGLDPSTKVTASKSEDAQSIADLQVASVALSSTVAEIHNPTRAVKVGDWAYLSSEDTQIMIAQRSLSATRKYPVVIAFSEGDTLDDEARVVVPRPPLPEVNRARGRIGFDYSGVAAHGAGGGLSSNAGVVIRTDITRINGTYWNLSGFWRGRLSNRSSVGQNTLQDLINRTYTIGLTYDNPKSNWVAGFGRLYLPWATSLDTIDGGYVGRKLSGGATVGIFAGTSPDPSSWSYSPDRQIGGAFVNFEGGSFDDLRYTSTSGLGVSTLKWSIDRPFVFFENGIFYKHYLSIYHSLQADSPRGNAAVAAPGPGVSRSFLTVRLQPVSRVEFDVNHTYFRDLPTYDPTLVGTGLLDKYLFQGFSGGARVQVLKNRDIWAYTTIGRSSRSSDTKSSWNQLYGVTVGRMPWIGVRTDLHYSTFNSSFGNGSYESVSFSRNFNDNLRWEVLGGRQSFGSPTTNEASHFVTGNFEASLGAHYFAQTGYTWNRGAAQNYDQWLFTFGYRFDSRSKRK